MRRAFGIVFQDPSLDGELTAAENMDLHGVLYRVPRAERRARVEALLRFVGLKGPPGGSQVCVGLTGGGDWIRTSSTRARSAHSRALRRPARGWYGFGPISPSFLEKARFSASMACGHAVRSAETREIHQHRAEWSGTSQRAFLIALIERIETRPSSLDGAAAPGSPCPGLALAADLVAGRVQHTYSIAVAPPGRCTRIGGAAPARRARWSNGIKRVHVTHRMEISSGYRLISRESAREACR